jgi:hypothetical protein
MPIKHKPVWMLAVLAALVGCGGGSSSSSGNGSSASTGAAAYSVSVNVSGLGSNKQVALTLNGGSALAVSSNGVVTFPGTLAANTSYTVAITSESTGSVCSLSNATGVVGSSNVSNVGLACATPGFGVYQGTLSNSSAGTNNVFYSVWLPGSNGSSAVFYGTEQVSATAVNLYTAQASLGSTAWQFSTMTDDAAGVLRSGQATVSASSASTYSATLTLPTDANVSPALPGTVLSTTGNALATSSVVSNGVWSGTWVEGGSHYASASFTVNGSVLTFTNGTCNGQPSSASTTSSLSTVNGVPDVFAVALYFSPSSNSVCEFASDTLTPLNGVAFVYTDAQTHVVHLQLMAVNASGLGLAFNGTLN